MMGTHHRAFASRGRKISQDQQHAGRPIWARGNGRSPLRIWPAARAWAAAKDNWAGPCLSGDRPM